MFSTSEMHTPVSSVSNQLQNGWNQQPPSCMQWGIMPLPNPRVTRYNGQELNKYCTVQCILKKKMVYLFRVHKTNRSLSSYFISADSRFIGEQSINEDDKVGPELQQIMPWTGVCITFYYSSFLMY